MKYKTPVISLTEPERLLRRFVAAASDAVKADNGTSLQVDSATLKVLVERLKGV